MNRWTELSIQYANQRSYLDDLFRVYPCIPEGIRDLDPERWARVEEAFQSRDSARLMGTMLDMDLFPIKDSYVAYLRRDRAAIGRNPATVARLCGRLYEMGLPQIHERCSEPKETNRQIGPLFRTWLGKGGLGVRPLVEKDFLRCAGNAVLAGSDRQLADFARERLHYTGGKGLDLVARFNGKYVVGEAKFLTDTGGHQNAQFEDAKKLLRAKVDGMRLAILDGVLYIPGRTKMFRFLQESLRNGVVLSSLVLREFLYQL